MLAELVNLWLDSVISQVLITLFNQGYPCGGSWRPTGGWGRPGATSSLLTQSYHALWPEPLLLLFPLPDVTLPALANSYSFFKTLHRQPLGKMPPLTPDRAMEDRHG